MPYEAELSAQEGVLNTLRNNLRQTRLPQRTINWQHNNFGSNRNITQQVLIVRKQRAQINGKIAQTRSRIISLREAILGVEK